MAMSTGMKAGIGVGVVTLFIGIAAAIGLSKAAPTKVNGGVPSENGVSPPLENGELLPETTGSLDLRCNINHPLEYITDTSPENHPCYTYWGATYDIGSVKKLVRIKWRLNTDVGPNKTVLYEASADKKNWTTLTRIPANVGYYVDNGVDIQLPDTLEARYVRARVDRILESRVHVEWA